MTGIIDIQQQRRVSKLRLVTPLSDDRAVKMDALRNHVKGTGHFW